MPTPVQLKRNGTPGASAPSSLLHGELALNYGDARIFWRDASNVIQSFTFQSYALASHTHTASAISDSTTAGRALLTAADAAAQRTSLGLGTLATQNGTFSGTSSGTNTGDQTITLTGDVTGSGTGSFAATLANTAVSAGSYGSASAVGTFTVDAKGRLTAAGSSNIAIAASAVTSGTLDPSRLPFAGTIFRGAVIVSTGLAIDANGYLTVDFGNGGDQSVRGNDARLSDTRTPTDNTVSTAKIQNDAVTYAKIQNVSATDRLLGRSSAGAGDVEEITCTSFGRSLIDDADAAAARTTLSVQPTASPAFTGTASFGASVSVGTSTPTFVNANYSGVHIHAATATSLRLTNATTGQTATDGFELLQDSGGGAYVWNRESTDLLFGTAATTRLTISSTGTATFAGQILADDIDTANSVAYGFDGDPDTGIGRRGANILTAVTNGVERVRVDASGRVGIGVTPASSGSSAIQVRGDLDIFGNGSDRSVTYNIGVGDDGITGWYRGKIAFIASGAANNISQHIAFFNKAGDTGGAALQERMRVNTDGYLLIGYTTSNGAYALQVNSQIYATNATIATSDARFKTNVESLTDATSVIESLRPVAFDFIPQEDRNFATERQVGLIAQEAQAALAGTDYADSVVAQCGDHLGLAYEKLVPVLIKALQESNARIAALEERING